jgi:hypothetical protein
LTRAERKKWHYEQTHKIIDEVEHKQCSKCKEFKPMNKEHFYTSKYNTVDAFKSQCKVCDLEYYKIKNAKPENKAAQSKRYKEWHQKNKQRMNEKCKQWMKDHKEQTKEYYKNWQTSEEGKEWNRIYTKQRAEHKTHNISKKQWEECRMFFDNECAYCGMPFDIHKEVFNEGLHKEHVDPFGSNELSNCVPACKMCNSEKHTTSLNEWYNINNPKFNQVRLDKILEWINSEYKKHIEVKKPRKPYIKKEVKEVI